MRRGSRVRVPGSWKAHSAERSRQTAAGAPPTPFPLAEAAGAPLRRAAGHAAGAGGPAQALDAPLLAARARRTLGRGAGTKVRLRCDREEEASLGTSEPVPLPNGSTKFRKAP